MDGESVSEIVAGGSEVDGGKHRSRGKRGLQSKSLFCGGLYTLSARLVWPIRAASLISKTAAAYLGADVHHICASVS